MAVVKMFGLEHVMAGRLGTVRKQELLGIKRYCVAIAVIMVLIWSWETILAVAAFTAFSLVSTVTHNMLTSPVHSHLTCLPSSPLLHTDWWYADASCHVPCTLLLLHDALASHSYP